MDKFNGIDINDKTDMTNYLESLKSKDDSLLPEPQTNEENLRNKIVDEFFSMLYEALSDKHE